MLEEVEQGGGEGTGGRERQAGAAMQQVQVGQLLANVSAAYRGLDDDNIYIYIYMLYHVSYNIIYRCMCVYVYVYMYCIWICAV